MEGAEGTRKARHTGHRARRDIAKGMRPWTILGALSSAPPLPGPMMGACNTCIVLDGSRDGPAHGVTSSRDLSIVWIVSKPERDVPSPHRRVSEGPRPVNAPSAPLIAPVRIGPRACIDHDIMISSKPDDGGRGHPGPCRSPMPTLRPATAPAMLRPRGAVPPARRGRPRGETDGSQDIERGRREG